MTKTEELYLETLGTVSFWQHYNTMNSTEKIETELYLIEEFKMRENLVEERKRAGGTLSELEYGKIFDTCEKMALVESIGYRIPPYYNLMLRMLLTRRWFTDITKDTDVLKEYRDCTMGEIKKEIDRMNKEGRNPTGHSRQRNALTLECIETIQKNLKEYIKWHKSELVRTGEQNANEESTLLQIEESLTGYYEVAHLQVYSIIATRENDELARKIIKDYDKPDGMTRRTVAGPFDIIRRFPKISTEELKKLRDDISHNADISSYNILKKDTSLLSLNNYFDDGESCIITSPGMVRGAQIVGMAYQLADKNKVYGQLGYEIEGMKKKLNSINEPVKDANVGASIFIALIGFVLMALVLFVPPVKDFFSSEFFNDIAYFVSVVLVIIAGIAGMAMGGIILGIVAVAVCLVVEYFLMVVIGIGMIVKWAVAIAGAVIGVFGIYSAVTDAQKISRIKGNGGLAIRKEVARSAKICEDYINSCVKRVNESIKTVENFKSDAVQEQAKSDLLKAMKMSLEYYDMALKTVKNIDIYDDGGF